MLGGFDLEWRGYGVSLPDKVRRLVAMIALRGPLPRVTVAERFWPDNSPTESLARLRTAIWRAHSGIPNLITTANGRLSLAPWVWVDVTEVATLAARMSAGETCPASVDSASDAVVLSANSLLPEWDDQWVLQDREHIRQLQVHALETMASVLLKQHRYGRALDSAIRAVRIEPMRESAHRAVIEVHLAESNVAEAVREYGAFRQLLLEEIGVGPSPALQDLVRSASRGKSRHQSTQDLPAVSDWA